MEEKINFGKISQLSQLDKRISVARNMLNDHAMPSVLLKFLADNTVSSVKWGQFKYSRMVTAPKTGGAADAANTPGDTIELSGTTALGSGYGPLYQQVSRFRSQTDVVQSVDLQSFQIDPRTGVVTMQIRLVVKPTYATFGGVRSRTTPVASAATVPAQEVPPSSGIATSTGQINEPSPTTPQGPTGTTTQGTRKPTASTSTLPVVKPPVTQ